MTPTTIAMENIMNPTVQVYHLANRISNSCDVVTKEIILSHMKDLLNFNDRYYGSIVPDHDPKYRLLRWSYDDHKYPMAFKNVSLYEYQNCCLREIRNIAKERGSRMNNIDVSMFANGILETKRLCKNKKDDPKYGRLYEILREIGSEFIGIIYRGQSSAKINRYDVDSRVRIRIIEQATKINNSSDNCVVLACYDNMIITSGDVCPTLIDPLFDREDYKFCMVQPKFGVIFSNDATAIHVSEQKMPWEPATNPERAHDQIRLRVSRMRVQKNLLSVYMNRTKEDVERENEAFAKDDQEFAKEFDFEV